MSTPLLFRFQKSTEARLFGPDQDIHTGSSTRLVNNAVKDGEGEKAKFKEHEKKKQTKSKQHLREARKSIDMVPNSILK